MRKLFFTTALFFICMAGPALSLPKIDVGGSAAEITKTISGYLETGKKKLDESVAIQTAITYGKGAAEAGKAMMEMKQNVEEKINAIKEDPLGAGLDAASDIADKTGLSENEKLQKAVDMVGQKTEDIQKLTDLEAQKEKLTTELNKKMAAESKTTQAKIDVLQKNNDNLQKMIKENPQKAEEYKSQIKKNEAEITALQAKLEITQKGISAESLGQLTDIKGQANALKNKAITLANAAKDKAAQQLEDKLNSMDSEKSLNETVSKNYLGENEAEDAENTTRIKTYRTYVAAQDVLTVFPTAVALQQGLEVENTETGKLAARAGALDGSVSAVNMGTQVSVKNIMAMAKYVEIMLLDMKRRTSEDLASIESVKQTQPSDDITSFNLDNYIYEPETTSEGK